MKLEELHNKTETTEEEDKRIEELVYWGKSSKKLIDALIENVKLRLLDIGDQTEYQKQKYNLEEASRMADTAKKKFNAIYAKVIKLSGI